MESLNLTIFTKIPLETLESLSHKLKICKGDDNLPCYVHCVQRSPNIIIHKQTETK